MKTVIKCTRCNATLDAEEGMIITMCSSEVIHPEGGQKGKPKYIMPTHNLEMSQCINTREPSNATQN